MDRRAVLGLAVALCAVIGLAGQPPAGKPGPSRLIIAVDKAPLMFGREKFGELAEGTPAKRVQTADKWIMVRVDFGRNWIQGWVRSDFTAVDTLAGVKVTFGAARRGELYANQTVLGKEFLQVRVKFEAGKDGPSVLFFDWQDEEKANLYLSYGTDKRIPPYGFHCPKSGFKPDVRFRAAAGGPLSLPPKAKLGSARYVVDRVRKQQTLVLKPGEALIQAYVFSVPVRVKQFDIVLNDVAKALKQKP